MLKNSGTLIIASCFILYDWTVALESETKTVSSSGETRESPFCNLSLQDESQLQIYFSKYFENLRKRSSALIIVSWHKTVHFQKNRGINWLHHYPKRWLMLAETHLF